MSKAENTVRKQIKGRFQPGQSGNPAGRPKGSRHKAIVALETLMGNAAEDVAAAVIKAAQEGDTAAARLVLDRVMPARKDAPISISLPPVDAVSDVVTAGEAVLRAVAAGQITPSEGALMMDLLERHRRLIETADLAVRVEVIEGKLA